MVDTQDADSNYRCISYRVCSFNRQFIFLQLVHKKPDELQHVRKNYSRFENTYGSTSNRRNVVHARIRTQNDQQSGTVDFTLANSRLKCLINE